tara:strand:+ start:14144 stop:14659 length:516 start_codon:yes stop_codon:yes gene_type:complete
MKISDLKKEDYNPYYATYIAYLKEEDLKKALKDDLVFFRNFMGNMEADKLSYAYEKGKWSVAEVLLHIIDTERIFQYRALCIARNDKTSFPGFDQDEYVVNANANTRNIADLLDEFNAVRNASITLFDSFNEEVLLKRGEASNSPLSVAAAGFIMTGHLRHHLRILKERYM